MNAAKRWQPPHALILLGLLALSFAFYAIILDNPFWDPEDFNFLRTTILNAGDLSALLSPVATERFHPLPLAVFQFEYHLFGLAPAGYYAVNLVVHAFNAFLVYLLVMVLLGNRRIAIMASVLFVLGVGSYGKAIMFVAGIENLIITLLYLSILNLYIRNDLHQGGRVFTLRYVVVLALFLTVSFAKPTTFSLVLGLLAYKVFFRSARGEKRRILEPNLVILVMCALIFWLLRELTGASDYTHQLAGTDPWNFLVRSGKNMVSYIIHMFFPIHLSRLVTMGNPIVRAAYEMAPVIHFFVGLSILSYGFFGFVFGNRALRFFIAWTFISLLPYCAIRFPADWLNIRYLYQVSIGFNFILAAGTVYTMDLLHRRRWRRFLPILVPLCFVLLSSYITHKLDTKYELAGASPQAREMLAEVTVLRDQGRENR
jgi:hypothetical protein